MRRRSWPGDAITFQSSKTIQGFLERFSVKIDRLSIDASQNPKVSVCGCIFTV
jgi:hypothetical protein